jgi:dTDP-4-dehydrorhamnose 3,5-epimerase
MDILEKIFNDVLIFKIPVYHDSRGDFIKLFNSLSFLNSFSIQQINLVKNPKQFTLRGLHYQEGDFSESKFFRVIQKCAQIAFVDLRKKSATYLQSHSIMLDSIETGIFIPKGFATGYLTLEDDTNILYCSDNAYSPEYEKGVRWNDKKFDIDWKCKVPNISDKDKAFPNWI